MSSERIPPQRRKDDRIALRLDSRRALDDVFVKDVTMFRAERMDDSWLWMACYLDSTGSEHDRITALPPTWCVVECMQGCRESWTIDSADFVRRLTVDDAERLVTPFLLDHEVTQHGRDNANA